MSKAYFSFKENEIWVTDELAVSWMMAMCPYLENSPEEWLNELNDFWKTQVEWLGVSNVIGTKLDDYITNKNKKAIFVSLVNRLANQIDSENFADKQLGEKVELLSICSRVEGLMNSDGA